MKKHLIIVVAMSFFVLAAHSQVHKRYLREGNEAYGSNNFKAAEQLYARSFDTTSTYNKAQFNMGNAQYKSHKFKEASDAFSFQAEKSVDKNERSLAYHNLGNSHMGQYYMATELAKTASPDTVQMLAKAGSNSLKAATEAYKNALRNSPTDDETRHNYALAKKLMEEMMSESEGGDQEEQDKEKEQEQKQQEQEEDQNQEKNDQEQEQQNDKQKEGEDQKEDKKDQNGDEEKGAEEGENSGSDPKKLSKQDVDKILEALKNKEEKLHQKILKKKKPSKVIKIEKDW